MTVAVEMSIRTDHGLIWGYRLDAREPSPLADDENSPFLLLHGLNGGSSQWRKVAEYLSPDRSVIAIDARGHGQSSLDGDLGVSSQVEDVARVVEQLGGSVHLVGASFGGVVALGFASTYPDKVRSVSTVGTALEPPEMDLDQIEAALRKLGPRRFFEVSAQNFSFGPQPTADMVESAVDQAAARDIETINRVMRSCLKASPRPFVRLVKCPALVCVGESDRTCPPGRVAALSEALGTDLEIVVGGGHLIQVEQPERVAELLSIHASSAERDMRRGSGCPESVVTTDPAADL